MYTLRPGREVDYSGGMENKLPITIRLTPRDKADLLRIARADKRKPARLAAIIIEEWLEEKAGGGDE
jgi:hypothetical protein